VLYGDGIFPLIPIPEKVGINQPICRDKWEGKAGIKTGIRQAEESRL
jgi:hypothetical protein